MKRLFLMLFVMPILATSMNSCRNESEDAGDEMEEAAEDTGDAIEEGAEETGDAAEDAVD